MSSRQTHRPFRLLCCLAWLAVCGLLMGSEHRGEVALNGVPVPGVVVTARKGDRTLTTATNPWGIYVFTDLADGTWNIAVEMTGFASIRQDVTIVPNAAPAKWELRALPPDQVVAQAMEAAPAAPKIVTKVDAPAKDAAAVAMPQEQDRSQDAADGFLINGSTNNGAASPFRESPAFGNNRLRARGQYNGGIGIFLDNSALDAQPFSLTGQNTPKLGYNQLAGVLTFGGPLRIPHLIRNGPNFFVGYQWRRDRSAATQSALVPDAAARNGIFTNPVLDPTNGLPFTGNVIPKSRFSPQALALLPLYPQPNFNSPRYNYQVGTTSGTHQDALQSRMEKALDRKNQVFGSFALQSTRTNAPSVLGFSDKGETLGINTRVNWTHRLGPGLFMTLGYQFSRFSTSTAPYFANRANISGDAGIQGNDQAPLNWGPPTLAFASGIVSLTDGLPASDHNQTSGVSLSVLWNRGLHSVTFGGDFRRQQFNYLSQQNPRGAFAFTGAATGNDFASFLLGIPDTVSLGFGNADKYFRESVYDGYVADDWRVKPEITLNLGLRWEYGAPITELYNRLVNLDVTPDFSGAAPVLAANPVGQETGEHYPRSLLRPDKSAWQPRVGLAWRPLSGSSLVVRAGYGVYYNTSIYQSIATQLAQQPPISKTFSVENTAATGRTLADAFNAPPANVPNTFAIDPAFRVGYAQNWQVSVQRDLPGSLQLVAGYLGIKGTRGLQEFLPNTFPPGSVVPCPSCLVGYTYLSSNGNSTREAGQLQLRRRLHNGFTALLQYTYSKSIDNMAAFGGQGAAASTPLTQNPTSQGAADSAATAAASAAGGNAAIAQNWLNLAAERALSTFDQRHLLSLQMQYTSGMGIRGGTLLDGWRGTLFKEWTLATQLTVGSGLPLNPVYLTAVPGTGITGPVRPDYTGASLYSAPAGLSLNPAAYAIPLAGQWGNAGRNTITGPSQFTLNTSLGRSFRLKDHYTLDLRVDAVNMLNHVTFTSWSTVINSAQFGFPAAANAMRSLQTSLRLRF